VEHRRRTDNGRFIGEPKVSECRARHTRVFQAYRCTRSTTRHASPLDMPRHTTDLADLTPRARLGGGGLVAVSGLLMAWLVQHHPERLRAPMWIAMCACASFVIAGVAMALHPFVSATFYRWLMVALLSVMGAIPLWIALGPGDRTACRSNVPFLSGEAGCRVMFGVGGVLVALMLCVAVMQALRRAGNEA
jgi:hypothetical protein